MDENKIAWLEEFQLRKELYYKLTAQDLWRARRMHAFLKAARKRGITLTLALMVDNQVCDIEIALAKGQAGDNLTEYLAQWIIGLGLTRIGEMNDMAKRWPELSDLDPGLHGTPVGEWVPQIDPEGP